MNLKWKIFVFKFGEKQILSFVQKQRFKKLQINKEKFLNLKKKNTFKPLIFLLETLIKKSFICMQFSLRFVMKIIYCILLSSSLSLLYTPHPFVLISSTAHRLWWEINIPHSKESSLKFANARILHVNACLHAKVACMLACRRILLGTHICCNEPCMIYVRTYVLHVRCAH